MSETPEGVVLQEITIRMVLLEEFDSPMVQVLGGDDDSLVTQLGLLELAKDTLIRGAMGEVPE